MKSRSIENLAESVLEGGDYITASPDSLLGVQKKLLNCIYFQKYSKCSADVVWRRRNSDRLRQDHELLCVIKVAYFDIA